MLKKLLILPIGFLLTNFLYISCCKCVDVTDQYYEVQAVAVNPLGSSGQVIDNGIPITVDTVYLNYSLIPNCVAHAKPNLSFLVNTATACSCRGCGDKGLKNKMTSLVITSDNDFNGIAANSPLNNFFRVQKDYTSNTDYSIDSLVNYFNRNDGMRSNFTLFTKNKPGNTAGHKLKLTMNFVNSSTVTVLTNPLTWQ